MDTKQRSEIEELKDAVKELTEEVRRLRMRHVPSTPIMPQGPPQPYTPYRQSPPWEGPWVVYCGGVE